MHIHKHPKHGYRYLQTCTPNIDKHTQHIHKYPKHTYTTAQTKARYSYMNKPLDKGEFNVLPMLSQDIAICIPVQLEIVMAAAVVPVAVVVVAEGTTEIAVALLLAIAGAVAVILLVVIAAVVLSLLS